MTPRFEREPINFSSPSCYGNVSHQEMQIGYVAKVLKSSCFKQTRGVQYRGTPLQNFKEYLAYWTATQRGGGGGHFYISDNTFENFPKPFFGGAGGGGGGRWGTACILGDVQIANSNKSLKHEVFLNLVSDKMRVPCLGPFTDQNGRFLYVYFGLL